jgi:hypothetical protein
VLYFALPAIAAATPRGVHSFLRSFLRSFLPAFFADFPLRDFPFRNSAATRRPVIHVEICLGELVIRKIEKACTKEVEVEDSGESKTILL